MPRFLPKTQNHQEIEFSTIPKTSFLSPYVPTTIKTKKLKSNNLPKGKFFIGLSFFLFFLAGSIITGLGFYEVKNSEIGYYLTFSDKIIFPGIHYQFPWLESPVIVKTSYLINETVLIEFKHSLFDQEYIPVNLTLYFYVYNNTNFVFALRKNNDVNFCTNLTKTHIYQNLNLTTELEFNQKFKYRNRFYFGILNNFKIDECGISIADVYTEDSIYSILFNKTKLITNAPTELTSTTELFTTLIGVKDQGILFNINNTFDDYEDFNNNII